jgi:diguanylate cyclase (GGDEF)-like protein
MRDEPRETVKFEKVIPIEPSRPTVPQGPEPSGDGATDTSPESDDEERPTLRGVSVALAATEVATASERAVLTVLRGLNAGQVFALERDSALIGRAREADVRIDDAGTSRRHARLLRSQAGRHILEDLGSANGIFVNGRRVERMDLEDGDRVQIGPAVLLRFGLVAADEEALARKLYEGSTRDALTRLYNRKYFGERIVAEVAYALRHQTPLSLLLVDIDHFKRVNDTFGHPAGDVVLRIVAAQAQKSIRAEDVLARFGGEEFVVLVRGIEPNGVAVLADRIRVAIERLSIPWGSQTLKTTVSVGVASLPECGPNGTVDALLGLADERLYKAKAGGRNRVC